MVGDDPDLPLDGTESLGQLCIIHRPIIGEWTIRATSGPIRAATREGPGPQRPAFAERRVLSGPSLEPAPRPKRRTNAAHDPVAERSERAPAGRTWPPVGRFTAANRDTSMAIDTRRVTATRSARNAGPRLVRRGDAIGTTRPPTRRAGSRQPSRRPVYSSPVRAGVDATSRDAPAEERGRSSR